VKKLLNVSDRECHLLISVQECCLPLPVLKVCILSDAYHHEMDCLFYSFYLKGLNDIM